MFVYYTKIFFVQALFVWQTCQSVPISGEYIFTIVVDAGSSGSRIHVYKFQKSKDSFGGVKLNDEYFAENEPGLSDFADNPSQGAKQIGRLLEKAKEYIPKDSWDDVPVMLKATAGLRLLPGKKSEAILDEVRKEFKHFPFKVRSNAVSILDSSYEGIYGWITVNFLKNKLQTGTKEMLAALDMGGASTEISFPTDQDEHLPSSDVHSLALHHKSLDEKPVKILLYSHNYLGLGLNAAKMSIFSAGNPKPPTVLNSVCVAFNKIASMKYQGINYTIHSTFNVDQNTSMDRCMETVKLFVSSKLVTNPKGILNLKKVAFSGFYWTAVSAELIDSKTGGHVSMRDLTKSAEKSCLDKDDPLKCVDMLYVSSLLMDGYHFTPETDIEIVNTIQNREVSWTLGAALHHMGLVKINGAAVFEAIRLLVFVQIFILAKL